jgi:hypothetical protein
MPRQRRLTLVVIATALVTSCFIGPSAHSFKPAVSGHGVESHLRVGRREVEGELLELRDSAYVLVGYDGIVLVPFRAVEGAQFKDIGSFGGGAPDPEWSERLHLASRFPQGMPASALELLLEAAHQNELRVVR